MPGRNKFSPTLYSLLYCQCHPIGKASPAGALWCEKCKTWMKTAEALRRQHKPKKEK